MGDLAEARAGPGGAGGATAGELLALAHEIQRGVREGFGVELVAEPVIVSG